MRWRVLLAALPLVLLVGPGAQPSGAAPCSGVVTGEDGWERLRPPPDLRAGFSYVAVSPLDRRRIWASDGFSVAVTRDGGCEWRVVYKPTGLLLRTQDVLPIQQVVVNGIPGAETVWVVESPQAFGFERTSKVVVATGGSDVFQSTVGLPPVGAVRLAAYPGGTTAVAVVAPPLAEGGLDLLDGSAEVWLTRDAQTWSRVSSLPRGLDPRGLIVSPSLAIVVWDDTTMLRSKDDGRTFEPVQVPHARTSAVAAGRALVVAGYEGLAQVSRDDGDTFRSVAIPRGVRTVAAVPGTELVALGTSRTNAVLDLGTGRSRTTPVDGLVADDLVASGGSDPAVLGRTANAVLVLPLLRPLPPVKPPSVNVDIVPPKPGTQQAAVLSPATTELVLDPGETRRVPYLLSLPPVPGPLDVDFLMDTTGSMQGAINGLRKSIQRIVDSLAEDNIDVNVGLGDFKDVDAVLSDGVYVRRQILAPPGEGLESGLEGLTAGGGGDGPEAHTMALTQSVTGDGQAPFIEAGRQAGFRSGSARVVVLISDAPAHEEPPYPSLAETTALLNKEGIRVVGIAVGNYGRATLETLASDTGTVAGPGGVDCSGDGRPDIPEGDPLVCEVNQRGQGALSIGRPIIALLEAVEQPGSVAVSAMGSAVRNVSGQVSASIDLARPPPLNFAVDYACASGDAGKVLRGTIEVAAADRLVARAQAQVTCRSKPAARRVTPVELAPVVAPAVVLPIAPPPPPAPIPQGQPAAQPNPNLNPNPGLAAGAVAQEQDSPQLAFVFQELEEAQGENELAMVGRPEPEGVRGAHGLLAVALAAAAGVGAVGRRRTAHARRLCAAVSPVRTTH
ncbi:MAG TPA: hypothetical protein VNA30_07165 [Mycobacteriales bacterium]|nr:hypothetical protein [Mycobacteriales bacterium]